MAVFWLVAAKSLDDGLDAGSHEIWYAEVNTNCACAPSYSARGYVVTFNDGDIRYYATMIVES